MTDEYTPTTEDVRGIIAWRHGFSRDGLTVEAFDRWLTNHLVESARAAAEKAWWEGVNDQWEHRPFGLRIMESANPYRAIGPKEASDG